MFDLSNYAVAYPHVAGESAGVSRHGHRMGKALAELHGAMRRLPEYPFDQIAAPDSLIKTRDAARIWGVAEPDHEAMVRHHDSDGVQLLHGDYNVDNLKINGSAVDILDFDNCGYGSPVYELANSLYMVLFDQIVHRSGNLAPYHAFRRDFLEGYRSSSPRPVEETAIDAFIDYRVLLLSSWLQHPGSAPLFVRQSTDAWLNTLRKFVRLYFTSLRGELNCAR